MFSVDGGEPRVGIPRRARDPRPRRARARYRVPVSHAERVSRARAVCLGGHTRARRSSRLRRHRPRRARDGNRAHALRRRGLRRLLLVARARDEPRAPLSTRRGSAAPELAAPAGRLSRPQRHGRGQRVVDRAAVRAVARAGRDRAALRPESQARHRARARVRGRRRQPTRNACAGLGVSRPRLRRRARQRLERAGPPGVGVPASRAVPRKVVRDLGGGLGDAARPARGSLRARSGAGARAAPVSPGRG